MSRVMRIIVRYKLVTILSVLGILVTFFLCASFTLAPFLFCYFHAAPSLPIILYPGILLWWFLGGAIIGIPLVCFVVAYKKYWYGTVHPEYVGSLLLLIGTTAVIMAAHRIDFFIAAPGGFVGVYAYWILRTIFGHCVGIRCIWIVYAISLFIVMQPFFLRLASYCISLSVWLYKQVNILRYRKNRSIYAQKYSISSEKGAVLEQSLSTGSIAPFDTATTDNETISMMVQSAEESSSSYVLPSKELFAYRDDPVASEQLHRELQAKATLLAEKLACFGVTGSIVAIKRGPVVTVYEYQPTVETKLSKIIALEDDLALALQAISIRIIAPIPGRAVVGFEVSNTQRQTVTFASIMHTTTLTKSAADLPIILGVDTTGAVVIADMVRMPHLLLAGSTGSGKSMALNNIILSLLCSRTPDECQFILIDPKRIEFTSYADIPHLLFPIVIDPRKAALVLQWVVKQMEERYACMARVGVRSVKEYNQYIMLKKIEGTTLPWLVIVIDELADLMMTAGHDVEASIVRIAQMARAAGIHLLVATQRPSVDVVTGLIKVNFPSRIAFRVASRIDSRTILDVGGADKLLGKGDLLFLDGMVATIQRLHGAYITDEEINSVVMHIRKMRAVNYRDLSQELAMLTAQETEPMDPLYNDVVHYLKNVDAVSISSLQREFRIGYNRSARIIEQLEHHGLILPPDGSRPRKIIR
jgi:DNA segregation ATPase FtsK/SpoIIIE, S-DNA-T family